MNHKNRVQVFVAALALLTGLLASNAIADDAPAELKNLQILPKATTLAEIKPIMVGVATAMGEKCTFCHVKDDYASDEKEHKKIARSMFTMVAEINKQFFSYEGAPQVTCYTCHRGAEEPVHQFSLPAQETKGSEAK